MDVPVWCLQAIRIGWSLYRRDTPDADSIALIVDELERQIATMEDPEQQEFWRRVQERVASISGYEAEPPCSR